jgi:glucose/arabinose dehydrogenase
VRRPGRIALLVLTTLVIGLAGCGGSNARVARARRRAAPTTTPPAATTTAPTTAPPDRCSSPPVTVSGPAGQSVFVDDANVATALAWAPDGRLFFAERSGAIRIAANGTVTTFATVPTVTTERSGGYSERGLLGLALSPNFATDHFVYAFASQPDFTTQAVLRFRDCAGVASGPETIITLPSGNDCCHKGGRLAFGPDGKLYVTLGEEHSVTAGSVGSNESVPQDPSDVRGKILRYNPDGTIPADNPFGPGDPAWAEGFRNPFGLAFGDGRAFVTSNGPTGELGLGSGYDLAFEVTAGGRYQWPACYGYSHLTPGATSCLGRPEPHWSSEDATVVPTGATWVDRSGPALAAGHFVFCTYNAGMRIFTPGSPHATVESGPSQCRLDVKQGPDNALYFSDDGAIYRLAA